MFRREHDFNLYWEFPGNLLRRANDSLKMHVNQKAGFEAKILILRKVTKLCKYRILIQLLILDSWVAQPSVIQMTEKDSLLIRLQNCFCKALMKSCLLLIFHNAIKQCFKSSKRTMSQFMMHFHFCKADFIDKAALLFCSIITSQKTHLRNWVELEKFWWMIHAEYIFINKYSANLLSSSLPYVNFQPMMISWERNVIMPKSKNNSLRSQIFNWARNSLNLNQQINKLNRLVVVLILLWRDYLFKTRGTHTSRRLPPV